MNRYELSSKIAEVIKRDFNTILENFDTVYGSEIPRLNPDFVCEGYFEPETIQVSPYISIIPENDRWNYENGTNLTVEKTSTFSINLIVQPNDGSITEAQIAKLFDLYTETLNLTLFKNYSLDATVSITNLIEANSYDALGGNSFRKWYELTIEVIYDSPLTI